MWRQLNFLGDFLQVLYVGVKAWSIPGIWDAAKRRNLDLLVRLVVCSPNRHEIANAKLNSS